MGIEKRWGNMDFEIKEQIEKAIIIMNLRKFRKEQEVNRG
jgi:hypothetical protein